MAQAAVHSYAVVCFDSKEAQDRALADPLRYFGIAIEGELLLFTVTFHANHAHNLTRSP
jgi:hypothetical protein